MWEPGWICLPLLLPENPGAQAAPSWMTCPLPKTWQGPRLNMTAMFEQESLCPCLGSTPPFLPPASERQLGSTEQSGLLLIRRSWVPIRKKKLRLALKHFIAPPVASCTFIDAGWCWEDSLGQGWGAYLAQLCGETQMREFLTAHCQSAAGKRHSWPPGMTGTNSAWRVPAMAQGAVWQLFPQFHDFLPCQHAGCPVVYRLVFKKYLPTFEI